MLKTDPPPHDGEAQCGISLGVHKLGANDVGDVRVHAPRLGPSSAPRKVCLGIGIGAAPYATHAIPLDSHSSETTLHYAPGSQHEIQKPGKTLVAQRLNSNHLANTMPILLIASVTPATAVRGPRGLSRPPSTLTWPVRPVGWPGSALRFHPRRGYLSGRRLWART